MRRTTGRAGSGCRSLSALVDLGLCLEGGHGRDGGPPGTTSLSRAETRQGASVEGRQAQGMGGAASAAQPVTMIMRGTQVESWSVSAARRAVATTPNLDQTVEQHLTFRSWSAHAPRRTSPRGVQPTRRTQQLTLPQCSPLFAVLTLLDLLPAPSNSRRRRCNSRGSSPAPSRRRKFEGFLRDAARPVGTICWTALSGGVPCRL